MLESPIQVKADAARPQYADLSESERSTLREYAMRAARSCAWLPHERRTSRPREIYRATARRFSKLERELYNLRSGEPPEDLKLLYDNLRLIRSEAQDLDEGSKFLTKLPSVRTADEQSIPRAVVLARALLVATGNRLTEPAFSFFLEAVQEI